MTITLGDNVRAGTLSCNAMNAQTTETSTVMQGASPIQVKGNSDTDTGYCEFKGNFVQAKNAQDANTELYLNQDGASVKFGVAATQGTLGSDGKVYSKGLTMDNTQVNAVLDGSNGSALTFHTKGDNGALAEKVRITESGYLLIGNTDGTNPLTVNGNIQAVNGSVTCTGMDMSGGSIITADISAPLPTPAFGSV